MGRVTWRGRVFDQRTADMLEELARLSGDIYINPTQGSYNSSVGASAGTHGGGGAADLMHPSWSVADYGTVVALARKIGFAAWHRTPQQSNWPRHCHLIAVACPDLSSAARSQVDDYFNNRNGLASKGRDDGPREWVGQTWESYQQQRDTGPPSGGTGEDDDMRIIEAPKKGRAIYGPGWFQPLNEEAYKVLAGQGHAVRKINDREYDVIKANVAPRP